MAEILAIVTTLIFVGLIIYSIKYLLIYLFGLVLTVYDITIFPEKTYAINRKTGQKFHINNFFYTGFALNQHASSEVIIALNEFEISEYELKLKFQGQYVKFRKYTFDNTHERKKDFWRVIFLTLLAKELRCDRLTMMFGRHTVAIHKFSPEQLPQVEKAVKTALYNAKIV